MYKFRLHDRETFGRYRIIEISVSSDWASRNPWRDPEGLLPYFFVREADNGVARVRTIGFGPFSLAWAWSK